MELTLHHLVREPKIKKDKSPLLLLLHGYGSNEQDLFGFAPELPAEYYVISVRAPHVMYYGGSYAWYAIDFTADEKRFTDIPQASESRELISKFIDEAIESYPIDPAQVTLVGFSQGAILSYAVALSYPQKVKQVAALSGYLNHDILAEGYDKNDFGSLRFFISHGSADQTVPVDWARKAKPFLDTLHIESVYKEYPVGHGVAPQNFFDFKSWLEK
jgi:phospholipase/carboxylesterase